MRRPYSFIQKIIPKIPFPSFYTFASFVVIAAAFLFLATEEFSFGGILLNLGDEAFSASDFRSWDDVRQLKELRKLGKRKGSAAVLAFLKRVYPDEPGDEHELVHIVGETAFLEQSFNGFDVCDSFLRFGCYHGVILEAIRKNGYSEGVMKNLANGCLSLKRNKTVITACAHGIGHGIMWVRSYDLLSSYEQCERMFSEPDNRFFCYDGVSMENVVRRDERPALNNQLESRDPYYPCNVVPLQYQSACAREHIFHARRVFFEKDTVKTARYCLHFQSEETRKECFGGLGNALNQDFFGYPQTVISECAKVDMPYRRFCLSVAATQYAFGGRIDDANALCDALNDREEQKICRSSVQSAIASLF